MQLSVLSREASFCLGHQIIQSHTWSKCKEVMCVECSAIVDATSISCHLHTGSGNTEVEEVVEEGLLRGRDLGRLDSPGHDHCTHEFTAAMVAC